MGGNELRRCTNIRITKGRIVRRKESAFVTFRKLSYFVPNKKGFHQGFRQNLYNGNWGGNELRIPRMYECEKCFRAFASFRISYPRKRGSLRLSTEPIQWELGR